MPKLVPPWVWAALALGALSAAFSAGWAVNGWRLGKRIAGLEANLRTSEGNVAATQAAIADQNAALETLKQAKIDQDKALAAAQAKAAEVRVEWRERIREVQVSAPAANAPCTEALQWASTEYSRLAAAWQR